MHIGHVLLVELDDLELGQQELGERHRLGFDLQALGDRQFVAHHERADEHLELAVPRAVPEHQPAVPVARVEGCLALVPEPGDQGHDAALAPRRRDEVDVGQRRARQLHAARHAELKCHPARDPQRLALAGGVRDHAARLVADAREDLSLRSHHG